MSLSTIYLVSPRFEKFLPLVAFLQFYMRKKAQKEVSDAMAVMDRFEKEQVW